MSNYNTFECIDATTRMLDYYINGTYLKPKNDDDFGRVYPNTNENISGYLSLFDMSKYRNALAVLSSGDHAFNLVHAGITDIDTFDCNRLTEYYALGLKRAMIMKYSYNEYLRLMKQMIVDHFDSDFELDTISDLLPFMDEEYRVYWKAIVNYAFKNANMMQQTLLEYLFYPSKPSDLMHNGYLKSQKEYELFKERLGKANINYTHCDARDLALKMPGKYDVILLSNIIDYFFRKYGLGWTYNILKQYEEELLSILSPEGVAFLNHLYIYVDEEEADKMIANMSEIRYEDITGANEAVIPFEWQRKGIITPQTSGVLVLKRGIGKAGDLHA